jgi:hypothetical protein
MEAPAVFEFGREAPMTRSIDIRCGSSGSGELALGDATPRALRRLSVTALASLVMLAAAGCGRAPIQAAGGPEPELGSFVESLPVGNATITWERVGDKWPDASTITVRRPGHPAQVHTCDSVAPPWRGMGGDGADEQAAGLRALDPEGRAPLLARCVVPGPGGQWFVAWLTIRYAATTAADTLTIVPVINGGLGAPVLAGMIYSVECGTGLEAAGAASQGPPREGSRVRRSVHRRTPHADKAAGRCKSTERRLPWQV